MSPILTISLAIVVSLWAIPLTWAFWAGVRALSRGSRTITNSVAQTLGPDAASEEDQRLMRPQVRPQDEYQLLKDLLILKRALLARAIDQKPELEKKVLELTLELQGLELKPGERTAAQRLKQHGMSAQIARFQRELEEIESKLASLSGELEEKERELKNAYPREAELFPKPPKADATNISKKEPKGARRERQVQTYGPSHLVDQNINYTAILESASRLPLDKLRRGELEELLETTKHALGNLRAAIERMEVNEELLSSQGTASDSDGRFQQMLDSSKKETLELKVMERKLSRKKEEIFSRIVELAAEANNQNPNK